MSAKRAGAEAAKTANAKAAAKAAGIAAAAAAAARAEPEAQAGTEAEAEVGMDPPSLQRFTSDDLKAAVSRVLLPKLMDREWPHVAAHAFRKNPIPPHLTLPLL